MPLNEIRDVRPPVDLPVNYFWLFVALGVLFFVGLFFFVRWLKEKMAKDKAVAIIVRPAWEIAQEELATLEKEQLPAAGKTEEYFVRLSAIIRHYLERRFSISVPDMTTDEFLVHVKTMPVLDLQQKDSLKEFLTLSDMVKFARYHSTHQEMDGAMTAAKRLLAETIPKVDPTVQP